MTRSLLLALALSLAPLTASHAQQPASPRPAPAAAVQEQLLVTADWLAARLQDPGVVVLQVGRERADYEAGHVPGARFVPLSSIVVERDGIPNELPETAALREVFEAAGVSDGSHVVLYGDLGGLAAGRAFFTLDYLGHPRVSLLDGGLDTWKAEGRALSTRAPEVRRGSFTPRPRPELLATAEWLRDRLGRPDMVILDARPPAEFSGEQPGASVDRPGHIPGARNIFWRDALVSEADPRLRPAAELRAMFGRAGMGEGRTLVTYCRTGVQASHAYFVARYLGYQPVLYDGSFIDWSRRTELPVAR